MTDAFARAYVWSGDPDHAAGHVMGLLCEAVEMGGSGHGAAANRKVQAAADEVLWLRVLHPDHALTRLLESVIRTAAEQRDAQVLVQWSEAIASDALRGEILAM